MNEQKWYCPKCGMVSEYTVDCIEDICSVCDSLAYPTAPPFVLAMQERIAEIELYNSKYIDREYDYVKRIAELEGFARELIKLSDFRGDIDGGDFQDLAIRYGILKGVEVAEPCGPMCNCAEYFGYDDFPQTCYRPTLPKEQVE